MPTPAASRGTVNARSAAPAAQAASQSEAAEIPTASPNPGSLTAPIDTGSMEGLLALALREKAPVEALERLVALKERVDANQAAQAFFAAKAAFQTDCPRIKKEGIVDYVPTSGGRVKFSYALLDDIDATVRPICNKYGLSYSWNSAVEGQSVKCDCILRHVGGHSETATFTCPSTSKAGMSDQQKYGAAVKYAMRWSLIQVLGLITTDDDDDTAEVDPTPITEDQQVLIGDLLKARKATWRNPTKRTEDFLAYMGVQSLAEIRAADYAKAVEALTPKEKGA